MQKIMRNKFSVMLGFPSYIDRDSMPILCVYLNGYTYFSFFSNLILKNGLNLQTFL